MEIINKTHDDIMVGKRLILDRYINFKNEKEIYISSGACRDFGISDGLKANFINDEKELFIYFDNSKDGFDLMKRQKKSAVLIFNAALIKLLLNRIGKTYPIKFSLTEINAKHEGHQLIKIETNKKQRYIARNRKKKIESNAEV